MTRRLCKLGSTLILRPGLHGSGSLYWKGPEMSSTLLWLVAAILVVVGIVQLVQGWFLLGVVFFIGACLVGPGGYSVFHSRRT